METRQVVISLPEGETRQLDFVRLPDGSWQSNAVLAVRRARGKTVYALAVHLDPDEVRYSRLSLSERHLGGFRELEPVIVGWADRPEIGWRGDLAPDAEPEHCDIDAVFAARNEPLHLHEASTGQWVEGCPACGRVADNWIPANAGREQPFISRSGRRLLYCYQPSSGQHAYLDCEHDIILSADEASALMG